MLNVWKSTYIKSAKRDHRFLFAGLGRDKLGLHFVSCAWPHMISTSGPYRKCPLTQKWQMLWSCFHNFSLWQGWAVQNKYCCRHKLQQRPLAADWKLLKIDFCKMCVVKVCVITSNFTQTLTVRQASYLWSVRPMATWGVTWGGFKGALFELKYNSRSNNAIMLKLSRSIDIRKFLWDDAMMTSSCDFLWFKFFCCTFKSSIAPGTWFNLIFLFIYARLSKFLWIHNKIWNSVEKFAKNLLIQFCICAQMQSCLVSCSDLPSEQVCFSRDFYYKLFRPTVWIGIFFVEIFFSSYSLFLP